VAFQIKKKFKADKIKSRNLDTKTLPLYYKELQQNLIKSTNVETKTPYFFCADYTAGEPLLIIGEPDAGQSLLIKAAGKGKDGFDKAQISIGSCFILKEDKKNILCLYPNTNASKGKKKDVIAALKKIQRTAWKQIKEVRWLTSPLMVNVEDPSKVESVVDTTSSSGSSNEETVQVPQKDVVKKAKDIKRGIKKLVKDVMPRYKKRETTSKDAAFVKALRKEGHLLLAQLPLTDKETRDLLSSQKEALEANLPKWKDLEGRIRSQKGKAESTAELKKSLLTVIKKMKAKRNEIKTLLKRVNFKELG
jgi:hypothetical protein